MRPGLGPRLPLRGQRATGLAREVPPARRPPGAEDDRPGLDRAGPPAGGLLHAAHSGGVARRVARRGARRHACPAWSAQVRRSTTRAPSTCATSSRTASASHRRCATTTRSSATTSSPHLGDDAARGPHAGARRALGAARSTATGSWRTAPRQKTSGLPRRRWSERASSRSCPRTRSPTSRSRATASRPSINVFSPEEVMALVRAADSEQDAAIFLTAAFTGLRQGELIALRWRDVDFAGSRIRVRASYTNGHLTSPKSGKVRSVPMAPDGRRGARAPRPARVLHRRRRPRLRRHRRRLPRRLSALEALPRGAGSAPACARCASTTSATPSARASSAWPTSAASRSGWATRTSRRPCSTSTTSRGPQDAALVGEAFEPNVEPPGTFFDDD